MKQKPPYITPYCLHCYAPLGKLTGASTHCEYCGHPSLTVDLGRLWTRERKVREWEQFLKVLVLLFIGGVSILMLFDRTTGISGHGHGMAAGAPILLGILLWDLVSLSQKTSLYRASLIWPIISGAVLLGCFSMFLFGQGQDAQLIGGTLSLLSIAGMITPPLARKFWLKWRARRIQRFQEHALESVHSAASA